MLVKNGLTGMRAFTTIWLGQLVSLIGSGLFGFAVGVWIYQQTGSVTLFALMTFFDVLPGIFIAPFAGAYVDRHNRRTVMIVADIVAAISTLLVMAVIWTNSPMYWLYPALALGSIAAAFQWPAYDASIATLIPEEHLDRANGMIQVGQALADLLSPILAGILVVAIGIQGILFLDVASFLFAMATLAIVKIPMPEVTDEGMESQGSLLKEAGYGFRYISARPGLMSLVLLFTTLNFFVGIITVLVTPLVLSFSTPEWLGTVLAAQGAGMLLGGFIMTGWGGFKRRMTGVFTFLMLAGFCIAMYGIFPLVVPVIIAAFGFYLCLPLVNASSQGIWQSRVAQDVQGRVFAMRRMIAQAAAPLAYVLAGPLADQVFIPMFREGGALAGSVGQIIGVGEGRGIGFMFVLMGFLIMVATAIGYAFPRLRNVEDELSDTRVKSESPAAVVSG